METGQNMSDKHPEVLSEHEASLGTSSSSLPLVLRCRRIGSREVRELDEAQFMMGLLESSTKFGFNPQGSPSPKCDG